jgi:hypothetical protein
MGVWIMAGVTFREAARKKMLWMALAAGGAFLILFGTGLHFQAKDFAAHGMSPMAEFPIAQDSISFHIKENNYFGSLARFLKPALNPAAVFANPAQATLDSEPFTHPNVWRPHEAHRNYGNCDYEFASCGGCSRPCAAGSTKRQTGSRPKG